MSALAEQEKRDVLKCVITPENLYFFILDIYDKEAEEVFKYESTNVDPVYLNSEPRAG